MKSFFDERSDWRHGRLCLFMFFLAAVLALRQLHDLLPFNEWVTAFGRSNPSELRDVLVQQSWLPRIVVAWLAGAALGLAATALQQVLRNPLAEPTTLGTASGAQFALVAAGLWQPELLDNGRAVVAMVGAALATALVFCLAARRAFSSMSLILAGLIVTLTCGAGVIALTLLHDSYLNLAALSIWGGGSLDLQGWDTARSLLLWLLVSGGIMALLLRPLALLDLEDAGASGLGLSVTTIRLIAILTAVALTGAVVSALGVISFVGLASVILARQAGARRLATRLLWAPAIGAGLLWLTDQIVQLAGTYTGSTIPVGVGAALVGVPLLLRQISKLRDQRLADDTPVTAGELSSSKLRLFGGLMVLVVVAIGLMVGQGGRGWHVSDLAEIQFLLPWRGPRVLTALAAGALLAMSGALTQRLTGNVMASPEILGINAGAALGLVFLLSWEPEAGRFARVALSSMGALATLALVIVMARGSHGGGDRPLLVGIAVSALLSAVMTLVIASGSLQSAALLNWMAGSTYGADWTSSSTAAVSMLVLLAAVPLLQRCLSILPLQEPIARALGLNPGVGRCMILFAAGIAAASGTLALGPLSFVGLIGPQAIRLLGIRRVVPFVFSSAFAGALITCSADWAGRNLLFPYELPAGLLTTLFGGPIFMWLLIRKQNGGRFW